MPASLVTSRRDSPLKLRSSSSVSAAVMIARRVASLRSSLDSVSRERDADSGLRVRDVDVRELGVRLFTGVNPTTCSNFIVDRVDCARALCTHVHSNIG